MDFLDFIPEYIFEMAGLFAGFSAWCVIIIQVVKEYKSSEPSTLSFTYTMGWGVIYLFWALYGIRIDATAIWITNGVAFILQGVLYVITRIKRA